MKKYRKSYALHKEYPFLRTTNLCEQWFGQTKPQKIKIGFKTMKGVMNVLRTLAVRISNFQWKKELNITKDINDAMGLLVSATFYKKDLVRPA